MSRPSSNLSGAPLMLAVTLSLMAAVGCSSGSTSGSGTGGGGSTPPATKTYSLYVDSGSYSQVITNLTNHVSVFTVSQTNGTETAVAPVNTQDIDSTNLLRNPVSGFFYSGSPYTKLITTYSADPTTGALTAVGTTPVPIGGLGGLGLLMDPKGRFLYATTSTNTPTIFSMNLTTGGLSNIGSAGIVPLSNVAVAIDATGSYLYLSDSGGYSANFLNAYTINSVSGALSLVASYTLGTFNPTFMTIDPGNKFLYVSGTSGTTTTNGYIYGYSITPSTGALTQIGTPLTGSVYYGYHPLVFSPTGNFAYAATASGTAPLTFNASTGALTPLSAPAVPGVFFFSLTIDPTGTLAWGISQINSYPDNLGPQFASYTINQTTGVFTQTGSYGPQPSPDTGFSAVNLVSH